MRAQTLLLAVAAAAVCASAVGGLAAGVDEMTQFHWNNEGGAREVCVSWGDTHMQPFGGASYYNIYNQKPFLMAETIWPKWNVKDPAFDPARAVNMLFQVHVKQRLGAWRSNTVDNNFAVRCGGDVVRVDNPRTGAMPSLQINGEVIPDSRQEQNVRIKLPSSPDGRDKSGNFKYSIRRYIHGNRNAHHYWVIFYLDCNQHEFPDANPNKNSYVSGFKLSMSFSINRSSPHNWGNGKIEAKPFWDGKMNGACGWLPRLAGNRINQPNSKSWLMEEAQTLFAMTKAHHAAMAKAGLTKVVDPKNMQKQRAACTANIERATGVKLATMAAMFKDLDVDVKKEMDDYVQGCAVDGYYGAPVNADSMKEEVCDWVDMAHQAVLDEIDEVDEAAKQCKAELADLEPLYSEEWELRQLCQFGKNPGRKKYVDETAYRKCPKKPTGGPLEQMMIMIDNMVQELDQAEEDHKKQYEARDFELTQALLEARRTLVKKVARLVWVGHTYAMLTGTEIPGLNELIAGLRGEIAELLRKIAEDEQKLRIGRKDRTEQFTLHTQEIRDTRELIQLLKDVLVKLATIKGAKPQFVELAAAADRLDTHAVRSHPESAQKAKVTALMEEMSTAMRRSSASAAASKTQTQTALEKLGHALIKECNDYIKELIAEERAQLEAWLRRQGELNDEIRSLTDTEGRKEDKKGADERELGVDEKDAGDYADEMESLKKLNANLRAQIAGLEKEKAANAKYYQDERKRRAEERATALEVRAMLEKKAKDNPAHLKNRINVLKK